MTSDGYSDGAITPVPADEAIAELQAAGDAPSTGMTMIDGLRRGLYEAARRADGELIFRLSPMAQQIESLRIDEEALLTETITTGQIGKYMKLIPELLRANPDETPDTADMITELCDRGELGYPHSYAFWAALAQLTAMTGLVAADGRELDGPAVEILPPVSPGEQPRLRLTAEGQVLAMTNGRSG